MIHNLSFLQPFGNTIHKLREDFKHLTEKIMKKTMQHANK